TPSVAPGAGARVARPLPPPASPRSASEQVVAPRWEEMTMIGMRAFTSLMAVTLGSAAVRDAGPSRARTTCATSAGRLQHLLRFAPRDAQVVEYGSLLGLKRAIGADVGTLDD